MLGHPLVNDEQLYRLIFPFEFSKQLPAKKSELSEYHMGYILLIKLNYKSTNMIYWFDHLDDPGFV